MEIIAATGVNWKITSLFAFPFIYSRKDQIDQKARDTKKVLLYTYNTTT